MRKNTFVVEISNISKFGVWVYFNGKEYFLDYEGHPWFKNAKVQEVLDVVAVNENHMHWPKLDVDIHTDSLEFPDQFPLIAR